MLNQPNASGHKDSSSIPSISSTKSSRPDEAIMTDALCSVPEHPTHFQGTRGGYGDDSPIHLPDKSVPAVTVPVKQQVLSITPNTSSAYYKKVVVRNLEAVRLQLAFVFPSGAQAEQCKILAITGATHPCDHAILIMQLPDRDGT
jgi:hypothetical protein